METKIIALDPGGTTGVAIVSLVKNEGCEPDLPVFRNTQLGPHDHGVELEDLLEKELHGADRKFVVCERFDYRKKSRPGLVLDSREYIGVTKTWCKRRGIPFILQSAAQGKGFVSDLILKELNLYTASFRHANDAMRHLLYFAINNDEFRFRATPYELAFRAQLLSLGFK